MKTYELTYIISSGASVEEASNVVKDVEGFIQSRSGVIISSQKSVAQTLAYRIKKQSSGYVATVVFQGQEADIKAIKEKVDKEKEVLRAVILVKRPVKEVKERRTRKPLLTADGTPAKNYGDTKEKKEEKVNPADLDKKLDEILSE